MFIMNDSSCVNAIDSLIIYKNVKKDPAVTLIKKYCLEKKEGILSEVLCHMIYKAEEECFEGNIIKGYIYNLFLNDENMFTLSLENGNNLLDSSMLEIAKNDLYNMITLAEAFSEIITSDYVCSYVEKNIFWYTPVNKESDKFINKVIKIEDSEKIIDMFINYAKTYGCGVLSCFKAFQYNYSKAKLEGINDFDNVTFDDIIGYKEQIKELRENTEAFINNLPANNILLAGARGTGKSTSVKALANEYYNKGLRLLEVTKEHIQELPKLLDVLRKRGRKFIIFIDDLSFDENERQYKYMKSIIEGGSRKKPDNVIFYATSNRRHIISEKWNDRLRGSEDAEVHTLDTLNEKLSLSDRFGITITFPKPNAKEYINMVKIMAKKSNIIIDDDILQKEAMKWELNQKGMSGRTARQFINDYICKTKKL